MNILEAIKSGKRFHRPGFPEKIYYPTISTCREINGGHLIVGFEIEAILADDWEVVDEKFTLTEIQIISFINDWMKDPTPYTNNICFGGHFLNFLKKQLPEARQFERTVGTESGSCRSPHDAK